MTDSSPFSPAQARLELPGVVLTAGQLRQAEAPLATMLAALPASAASSSHTQGHASLSQAGGRSWVGDDLVVICQGEPYWRDGDAADPQEIGARFRHQGADLLDALAGQFTLVISDEARGEVFCAVDRFAREPIYWHGDGQGLALASSADALLAHPAIPRQLSQQGLFNYLFFHMVPAPGTVYEGLHKLPAAHCLRWRQGSIDIRPYWLPTFHETSDDVAGLKRGVLGSLGDAVARCSSGADSGSFLSGGLDSSTVSGLLASKQPGADAYSIGFDAAGYDEIAYARITAQHFGLTGHEYYVRPDDVLDALPSVATAYDEPFGNSSALPALFCAALARQDGKRRLLAGDGGDELYAGNSRYAKQKVFEIFQGLPAAVQGLLRAATGPLPGGVPLLSKAKSYVTQASVPLPDRLQSYNYLCRLGVDTMFTPDFSAGIDTDQPFQLDRDIYHRPAGASSLNRMLYLDWHHTLADNDLRKVGRMCALAGMEVRYPMLDEAVLENSLRIPSALKLPGGRLRDFYKQATSDFLPSATINKSKQGFGLPFGVWMAEHPGLREMAGDNLARLRRRDILQAGFIDQVLTLHQQEHAHYYGELVWVMMMLELWLTSRGFEP